MATLHRHLKLHGPEHDRLEFRADCPHCRARLAGRYPLSHLLSRRAEATLATGAVVAGTLLPAAGAAADLNVNAADVHAKLHFNPPAVVVDNGDQGGGDNEGRQSDHGGGTTGSSSSSDPARSHTPEVTVDIPPARSPAPPPRPPREPAPAPEAPQAHARPPAPDLVLAPNAPSRHAAPASSTPSAKPTSKKAGSLLTAADTSKGASGARGEHAAQGSPKKGRRGASAVRTNSALAQLPSSHVVRPGESLWTIAEHQLGDHASDAKIAAAVERLWRLNAQRIATGNPDLIYPGQTLQMPWMP